MGSSSYAGLVSRAVALVVDAVVIDLVAVVVGAVVALIGSLFGVGRPGVVAALTGGFLWLGWTGLYFVVFWVVGGQTPGGRLLGVRVVSAGPRRLGVGRAVVRFVVMMVALVPLGAGFVTVLFDDRRRGPHDMVAGTVARWVTSVSGPAVTVAVAVDMAPAPGPAITLPGPAPGPGRAPAPAPPERRSRPELSGSE